MFIHAAIIHKELIIEKLFFSEVSMILLCKHIDWLPARVTSIAVRKSSNIWPTTITVCARRHAASNWLSNKIRCDVVIPVQYAKNQLPSLAILLHRPISNSVLVPETIVFIGQALALLLERLNVSILLSNLLLETSNFANSASLSQLGIRLAVLRSFASELLNFGFQAQRVKNHDIGPVEDEGEEECEAAKVHIALGIKLSSLDFHALTSSNGTVCEISISGQCNAIRSSFSYPAIPPAFFA